MPNKTLEPAIAAAALAAQGQRRWADMIDDYPRNSDGDALRRVAGDGSDMAKSMVVDFTVVAKDEASATSIARAAIDLGYEPKVETDDGEWWCTCSCSMVLTYESVVAAQVQLNTLAAPLGGSTDGWGTFGNV